MAGVYYTKEFADAIKNIANSYMKISQIILYFVDDELHIYAPRLAKRIKETEISYDTNHVSATFKWYGSSYQTIRRAVQKKYCQEDLFDVIGYYLHRDRWRAIRSSFVVSKEKKEKELSAKMSMKVVAPCKVDEDNMLFVNGDGLQLNIFRKELKEEHKKIYDKLSEVLKKQEESLESLEIFRNLLQKLITDNEQIKKDFITSQQFKHPKNLPKDKENLLGLWWMVLLARKGIVVNDLGLSTVTTISTISPNDNTIDTDALDDGGIIDTFMDLLENGL